MKVEDLFPEVKKKKKTRSSEPAMKAVEPKGGTAKRVTKAVPSTSATRKDSTPPAGIKRVAATPVVPAPVTSPPRLKLICGTGIGLTLVFVCLVILNASMQISTINVEEKITAGEVAVRHETWEEGNAIMDVVSLDPAIAEVDIFLVQDEEEPGYVHFLIQGIREGAADIVIEYENEDRKIIAVTVEPGASSSALVKEDRKSKTDTLERVRDYLKTGDELMSDATKSVENVYKSLVSYRKAQKTLKGIRLHQFLPEYKGLDQKIKAAQDQIEVSYKKVESEYQVARDRKMEWKARELLKVLMQIVPDPEDPRYLKNRTYLDYLHSEDA